jgi:hypothetical protein
MLSGPAGLERATRMGLAQGQAPRAPTDEVERVDSRDPSQKQHSMHARFDHDANVDLFPLVRNQPSLFRHRSLRSSQPPVLATDRREKVSGLPCANGCFRAIGNTRSMAELGASRPNFARRGSGCSSCRECRRWDRLRSPQAVLGIACSEGRRGGLDRAFWVVPFRRAACGDGSGRHMSSGVRGIRFF